MYLLVLVLEGWSKYSVSGAPIIGILFRSLIRSLIERFRRIRWPVQPVGWSDILGASTSLIFVPRSATDVAETCSASASGSCQFIISRGRGLDQGLTPYDCSHRVFVRCSDSCGNAASASLQRIRAMRPTRDPQGSPLHEQELCRPHKCPHSIPDRLL